jgi:hypothetical protein
MRLIPRVRSARGPKGLKLFTATTSIADKVPEHLATQSLAARADRQPVQPKIMTLSKSLTGCPLS